MWHAVHGHQLEFGWSHAGRRLRLREPARDVAPFGAASARLSSPREIAVDLAVRPERQGLVGESDGFAGRSTATGKNALTETVAPLTNHADGPLKIEAVELIELHGTYTEQAGVNAQTQVNPLDVYDDLRPAKPAVAGREPPGPGNRTQPVQSLQHDARNRLHGPRRGWDQ